MTNLLLLVNYELKKQLNNMKTWEYKNAPFSITDWNLLGSEGWELVSTTLTLSNVVTLKENQNLLY